MNDQEFRKLFQEARYKGPSEIEVARWKRIVRRELIDRTPAEWTRLAAACLVGFAIGAVAFKGGSSSQKYSDEDATVERVYVNSP